MTQPTPKTELNPRFSSPEAEATAWEQAEEALEAAEIFWISTTRTDGRPHVTPLVAVWQDGALHFCTGPTERKAKNLAGNPHCILTTGNNLFEEGLDLVLEGQAVVIRDEERLQKLAGAYAEKYDWQYEVRDGAFFDHGLRADVYRVQPKRIFGFGRTGGFSQTRYQFPAQAA